MYDRGQKFLGKWRVKHVLFKPFNPSIVQVVGFYMQLSSDRHKYCVGRIRSAIFDWWMKFEDPSWTAAPTQPKQNIT